MALKQPESMKELAYFTDRDIGNGRARVWVFKEECTTCQKTLMSKPKMRAKEYVCTECGHSVPKDEYEETLVASVEYECSECHKEGEVQQPFLRKKIKGVPTLRVLCESCGAQLDVTKKMKVPKDKKKKK